MADENEAAVVDRSPAEPATGSPAAQHKDSNTAPSEINEHVQPTDVATNPQPGGEAPVEELKQLNVEATEAATAAGKGDADTATAPTDAETKASNGKAATVSGPGKDSAAEHKDKDREVNKKERSKSRDDRDRGRDRDRDRERDRERDRDRDRDRDRRKRSRSRSRDKRRSSRRSSRSRSRSRDRYRRKSRSRSRDRRRRSRSRWGCCLLPAVLLFTPYTTCSSCVHGTGLLAPQRCPHHTPPQPVCNTRSCPYLYPYSPNTPLPHRQVA
jgi:hypothetical protein